MLTDLFDYFLRAAGALGLPAILLFLLRDRRKVRTEGNVGERTENAQVIKADAGAIEAHVLAVERAFTAERESKDRRIASLEEEVRGVESRCQERTRMLEEQLDERDRVIAHLRQQVATLTAAVTELRGRLEVP